MEEAVMGSAKLVEWFRDEPLPGVLPDPSVVVGGTSLLGEFMSIAAQHKQGGQMSIAAPYVRAGVDDLSCGGARHDHQAGVLFVGTTDPDVCWIMRACAERVSGFSTRATDTSTHSAGQRSEQRNEGR